MKPPKYMKISFEKQEPSYRGTIKGGWIKIPPNKNVGLPMPVYVKLAWYYRMWIVIKMLSKIRIVKKEV